MYSSQQNLNISYDVSLNPLTKLRSISKTSFTSVNLTKDSRRLSFGQSIGRFITKKLTKRALRKQKLVRIAPKRGLTRNTSINSVDFWEEEWATIKKRRSTQGTDENST